MREEKQKIISDICPFYKEYGTCEQCETELDIDGEPCYFECMANAIINNASYRKQSEGEWLPSDIPQEKYVCSVCGGACWYYDYQGYVAKSRYCPNCGAKMKGESNGTDN